MERTKIVATLGPACDTTEMIRRLINEGVDVFRLNFSHGDHATHARNIRRIRSVADKIQRPVAVLMDLQGPKIRTGPLADGEPVTLFQGQPFMLTTRSISGDARGVSTTYADLPRDVRPGDRILISDGLIELRVERVENTDVYCEVVTGGTLTQRQGINLPGTVLTAPAITEKDRDDLVFGLKLVIDYVALSFVRSAQDVDQLRKLTNATGVNPFIIAKIERPEALDCFPEILRAADGIMIARGDLGVEISPEQVPLVQKQMIAAANLAGKPVITATQMLDSMIRNPRPTRAETSDVANAIIDGTDAVMLSGETATGRYPIEAVRMMARIAPVVEAGVSRGDRIVLPGWDVPEIRDRNDAIAEAACSLAERDGIRAIVVFTQSGLTARLVSRRRPATPVYALTPDPRVYRQLALVWGITPLITRFPEHLESLEKQVFIAAKKLKFAAPGDVVLLVGGHPLPAKEPTNFIKIVTVENIKTPDKEQF
jgi:pyruvate kinase